MFFLIIQLFRTEYKEDVLLALKTCDINKGCTLEGENLENALEHDYPLFKGLIHSSHQRERHSIMICSVVENVKSVKNLVQLLEQADINIKEENILRLILMPAHLIIDIETDWEFAG